ncbi:MAG: alpha/beta fold hydrolase [Polyangiaceae bacterium]
MTKPANDLGEAELQRAEWAELIDLLKKPRSVVGQTPARVVHQENKLRVLRYTPRPEGISHKTPIVIVPSLINRNYVLDLLPGKSFVAFLVEQGHDVYMIDWGTPSAEDRHLDFDVYCDRYISRAIRAARRHSGALRVHLLGYCLGGTLTSIYAAAYPERVATLTALAAPIDFHDGGLLSAWTLTKTFDLPGLVKAFANVPWPLMQASFHMLRPTLAISKLITLIDRRADAEFLRGFFATEIWGNDNVSFPGACYQRYIQELYRENRLVRGEFVLSGRAARLDSIACPTLVVTFRDDHIVPWRGAARLHELISSEDKDILQLPGGHVGAVVSRRARAGLWKQMSDFWANREDRSVAAPPVQPESREQTN